MIERINLIPDEILIDKKAVQKRPLIISILILYFLCLGAVFIYQKANIKKRLNNVEQAKMQRDELVAQNTRYREVIERINLVQKKEEDIKKRLAVISSLLEERVYWSEILRNLTHRVPNGIWLTSLSTNDLTKGAGNSPTDSIGGKGVKFNGTSLSNSAIAAFVFALENSSDFENVILVYSQKKESQDRDLYDFEISTDLRRVKR
jgi:Tfp pilus assembly protein PilN